MRRDEPWSLPQNASRCNVGCLVASCTHLSGTPGTPRLGCVEAIQPCQQFAFERWGVLYVRGREARVERGKAQPRVSQGLEGSV